MAIKRTILTTVVALVLIAFVITPSLVSSFSGNAAVSQPANSSNTAIGTPTLTLSGPSDVNINESFTLTATLKEANGDSHPNTLVTFTANGATVGNATTDGSGVASLSHSDPTAHNVTYVARVDDAGTTSNGVTVIVHALSPSPSPSPSAQPTSSPSVSPSPEPSATSSPTPPTVTPNPSTSDAPKSTATSSYSDPPDPTLSPTTSHVSNAAQSNNAAAAKTFLAPWLASSAKSSDPQGTNGLTSVELKNCTTTLAEPMSASTTSQTCLVYAPTWLAPTASSSVLAEAATMSAAASALQGGSGPTPCVTPTAAGQTSQNGSAPNLTLPAAQTNGAAGLPTQSVFEFSILGLGAPALLVGLLYLLLRRV